MDAKDFDHWVDTSLSAFEAALDSLVPVKAPAGLGEAMRYAVLGGGKRLRPLL
ncbi:MAG TPA: polyprenyl synthetase family protein, partial [Roseateles sp.]|nr:polyprenyl synthetase family protein [Roseateles sp.]